MFKKKGEEGRTKNNPQPNTNTKQDNSKNKIFWGVKCEVLFSLVRLELKLYYSYLEVCVYFLYNCSWEIKLKWDYMKKGLVMLSICCA